MIKALGIFVLVVVGIYSLLLVGLVWTQRSLLYHPRREAISPVEAGFPKAQVLRLQTPDHESLVAWYVPAAKGKPLLLYFQGNGEGLSDRAQRFAGLTADGNGLLAVSYRSYFGSSGVATEAGLHIDAQTGYAEAQQLGYTPDRIVVVGESLGTGVAVALAARNPVAALVLDSPFSSAADVAAQTYWMFPVRLLMLDPFHSDQHIGDVHVPVLMLHGTADTIIPLPFAEKLFGLAKEPKELIVVPGAGHLVLGRPDILPRVLQWVSAHVGGNEP